MCTSYANCADIMWTNIRIRGPSEPHVERQRAFGARSQGLSSTGTISDDGSGTKTTQQPPEIVMPRLLGQFLSMFCAFSKGCVFPEKSTYQKSCTQSVPFVHCGRGLCLDCGARCAQDSSEDGFVRTETRKLSKKKFLSSLAGVWGHLRQEMTGIRVRSDPVRKEHSNAPGVRKENWSLRRSSLEPFAARSAHSGFGILDGFSFTFHKFSFQKISSGKSPRHCRS